MKLLGVLFLTLSAETPGSSMFVIVPDVISQAGTGALLAMIVAAAIALCMAQVYAELGSAFPIAGGEYCMVGRTLGPLSGFVVLGLNLVNSLFGAAVLSLGVSAYLSDLIPGLQPIPTALVVVLGSTLLGVLNIRTNAFVTGAFLLVELLALAALAWLGFQHPARNVMQLLVHPQVLIGGAPSPASLAAIGLAVTAAIFAYDGYGGAVYFAEELHAAPRRIGRAIVLALLITVVAEFVPLTAVLTGAPDLKALLGAENLLMGFIQSAGGRAMALVVGLAVALAIINAVIAVVLLSARQLYCTGRDETWPGPVNAVLARVHPRFGSPWAATLVTGAITWGLCLIPLKMLIIATGASVAVVYMVLCVGVLAGRATGSTGHGVFRMRGFPLAPVLALIALVGVLWAAWLDPAEGRPGLIAAVGVGAASGLYFLLALRRRGWTLRGPDDALSAS
jgi:amino acid transporter